MGFEREVVGPWTCLKVFVRRPGGHGLRRPARQRRRRAGARSAARIAVALAGSLLLLWPQAAAQQTARESLARVASLQNAVETRATDGAWSPSALNQSLYERYRVRTGAASR